MNQKKIETKWKTPIRIHHLRPRKKKFELKMVHNDGKQCVKKTIEMFWLINWI